MILPLVTQHQRLLFRGHVYTGLTRARWLAVFVGERRALALAVRNAESSARQTVLTHLITSLTTNARAALRERTSGASSDRGTATSAER